MKTRYWVIGGEYADCEFGDIRPGTETMAGPFDDELRARTEWQRLTFRDKNAATTRFAIAIEPAPIWQ
ncbi:MAG: hypothetical protein ABIO85_05015 [Sphingomicrobium sp.]